MLDAPKLQSVTFEIRPSDTMVGAEVLGLDLSKPLDEAAYEKVSAALDSFSVVCFRD
jgi:taurine dioxygenase